MASVTTIKPQREKRHPRKLDPEPWGHQLARAREDAGWTQKSIASALRGLKGYSYGTIQRLESERSTPGDEMSRGRAYVLVTAYGYDPADFGLSDADAPPWLDLSALSDLRERQMRWFPALVAA